MAYSLPSLRQNENSFEQIVALPHCIIVLPLPFMEVKSTEYLISSPDVESCPKGTLPEVAFIGRSNVGKSSLINMLSNKKELAKVSSSPGKTQMINHFLINKNMFWVDLPGYGFAKVSQTKRGTWTKMIWNYVEKRDNLQTLFVLIDSRHTPQRMDIDFVNKLGEKAIPFTLVFTKADKESQKEVSEHVSQFKKDFEITIGGPLKMTWELYTQEQKPKMAIFVSKYDHCLYDILGRFSTGELPIEIPLIISNHLDLKAISDCFSIPFYNVPFTKDTKIESEKRHIELLQKFNIDFIVLQKKLQEQGFDLIYDKNSYINKVPKYAPAEVKVVKTKTFHDPETGYYVISQFNILGITANQSYRCDLTAFDQDGKEIISWKTEGLSFSPRPATIYSGQTNIKPDQVPTVKSSTVKCEVADAI